MVTLFRSGFNRGAFNQSDQVDKKEFNGVTAFRLKFNRGMFNRVRGKKVDFSGSAALSLSGEAAGKLRIFPQNLTDVRFDLDTESQPKSKLYINDFGTVIRLNADGLGANRISANTESILFAVDTQGKPLRAFHLSNLESIIFLSLLIYNFGNFDGPSNHFFSTQELSY